MKRRVTALAGLALVGLLAGCAEHKPGVPAGPPPLAKFSSAGELSTAVMERMKADKTAKMTLTGGVDGQPDQQFYGVGVLHQDEGGTSMQFAEQVQRPGAAASEVRLVVQPDATFLKPPADVVLPPRKSWLQLGRYTTDPFYRRFVPMAAALRAYADPQAFFAQYGGAITITHSAEEPVDGTRAVRYDLRADPASAGANQARPAIEQVALHPTTAESLTSVNYTIWLDENNHPIRTLVDEPIPGTPGPYSLDSHYTRWGDPVYIGAPQPLQVTQQ
ncbi:MAG: hypothetical protein QOI10_4406 [Solirubrobacterales bacterium]|jgi:hypothetical protein|nr:hypothetical protein [Solirubrobacterales bacterium]